MNLELADLIEALSRPEAYPHPVDAVEVHQTHISVVFLAGAFAYKIKKPVNFGFVDFSTLEKRKHFCDEEVRLNRRLAPEVYLGVCGIVNEPETLATEGGNRRLRFRLVNESGPPPLEWAVRMKRLPADATLESRLERGQVTAEQIRALAARIADFHRQAETNEHIASFGNFDIVADNARQNLEQAATLVGITASRHTSERVRFLTEALLHVRRRLIESRAQRGVPRDTHGDLHLDHVYLFREGAEHQGAAHAVRGSDLVIVDCIEFSDRFRYADPVADMAFLYMDLAFHGRRDLARVFAEAYFAASGDMEGRELLPFYVGYRAMVRAKVEGMELGEPEIDAEERDRAEQQAKAHWLLAWVEMAPPTHRPGIVLLGGLPGVGKSTLAWQLAKQGDFTLLRSDVIRKEISTTVAHASGSSAEFEQGIYSQAWTERTYAELLRRTEALLWEAGRVLIDANFRSGQQRQLLFDAARRWGVPIVFVHCHASADVVRARLQGRRHDASDADWNTYQKLEEAWEPIRPAFAHFTHALDTSGPLEQNIQSLQAILRQEGLFA